MSVGEHRIARQIIEVVARDRDSAEALANRVAAAAAMVAATLERRFDAIDDGRRRRIERLVLTLDPCDRADFERNLLANLDSALVRALPEQLTRVAVVDPAEDALELIAAFLRKGVLPWWSGAHATALAEAAETLILADNSRNAPGAAAFRVLLGEADTATRLVRALPASMLPRLAAWLADLGAEDLGTLAIILTAEQREPDPGAAAISVWSAIMVAAAQQAPGSIPEVFASEARACLAREEGRSEMQDLQNAPLGAASDPATPPTAVNESRPAQRPFEARNEPGPGRDTTLLPEEHPATDQDGDSPSGEEAPPTDDGRSLPSPKDAPLTDNGGDSPPDPGSRAASRKLPDAPSPDIGPPSDDAGSGPVRNRANQPIASPPPDGETTLQTAASTATEHDSIYVQAAGIILLGPFLSGYFAAAGLIDSECRFTTPAARHRAVALIEYLATADSDPPESRLALAKLLAGMPIDTVLRTSPLDEAEAMSAEALLAAVLAELPMLGRLTVNGFRSAWLNRPGLLTVEHGGWLLRIERRSWDMLLDRLEWSIGWLQLPWQPEGIRVEW